MVIFIRKKIEKSGKTMAAVADEVGVSRAIVSEWASGRKLPAADKLPKLSSVLGCSIDELFVDDEKEVS